MDQAYWDSQYKFTDILPDFHDWVARARQQSDGLAAAMRLTRYFYGKEARQWVEISPVDTAQPIVPVFIHGGFWRAQMAEDYRFALAGFGHFGPGAANLEYRLIPAVRMAEVVADAVEGLKLLLSRLAPHQRLLPIGHSAGGHLALAAALRLADPSRLAGVVSISGVFDLASVAGSFLQETLHLTEDEITAFDLMGKTLPCRQLYLVGADETPAFHDQARAMAAHNGEIYKTVPSTHHMSVVFALASPEQRGMIGAWLEDIANR